MIKMSKIVEFFSNLIKKFAAVGSEQGIRLRFGNISAVLGTKRGMILNSRKPFIYENVYFWSKCKGELYIVPKFEPNPHIVISGMSGFGKSTLFKSLLFDIRKYGTACIVFDAHNEHSDIVRDLNGTVHNAIYSGINLLELDGASIAERISELSRLLKEVYSLGYIQTTKLSECLWYTYRKAGARSRSDRIVPRTPLVGDLVDEINIFIRNSRGVGERNTLLHLRDRLSLLNSSAFKGNLVKINELGNGINSFALAGIKSKEAQLVYIGELLNRLYASMHDSSKQNSLRLYIMIDEAQFLVESSNSGSVISKLIEEGRKYGVGVIIVTHAASTLNKKIMANCSTFATFYAREPAEVNYITKILSGNNPNMADAVRGKINSLRVNQAVLISSHFRTPILISTPTFRFAGPLYTGLSESEMIESLKSIAKRPIRRSDLQNHGIVIKSSIITRLEGLGVIDRLLLQANNEQEEWIMLHNNSVSIEHEVWVRKICDFLNSNGIRNSIIDNSKGPDISLVKNGKRIAIEYETGSKRFESTVKMIESRSAKYDEVIIVTGDSSYSYYSSFFSPRGIIVMRAGDLAPILDSIKNL
jgi:Helicase HerA, central domain